MSTNSPSSRRRFLCDVALAAGGLGAGLVLPRPAWAQSNQPGLSTLTGQNFDLDIGATPVTIDGKRATATGINGTVPGPLLRFREGDRVVLNVANRLQEMSSIHWHGLLLPSNMDGVPGLSFAGIAPGGSYRYEFTVRQNGTYWYHSHSEFQEQTGVYGPLVIDPADSDPVEFDREFVLLLSDWTFEDPNRLMNNLKVRDDYYNYNRRTFGEFLRDAQSDGLDAAAADRRMWGSMRMKASDIADITVATYTYLVNGLDPAQNWTGLFEPGERVRLRLINGSAQTFFNLRIPGLEMTVVQADGQNIEPVAVDEIQIGVAETYDVVVSPTEDRAYTIFAETMDRSGFARGTLTSRQGLSAPVPELRKPPRVQMRDMGMDHGAMDHGSMDHAAMDHGSVDHGSMDHESMGHDSMNHGAMNHDSMDHGSMDNAATPKDGVDHAAMGHGPMRDQAAADGEAHPGGAAAVAALHDEPIRHDHRRGPGVANVAANPLNRLDEPGQGLADVGHRVLRYSQLRSFKPNDDERAPGRTLELHLTGNMERYMWSFDGIKYTEVDGPIRVDYGERLRMILVNDTMMSHPIHLHGMFFELVNGNGRHNPRKHTVVVKPAERLAIDITADEPGHWAFHCHMLYHMKAGMMRSVLVADAERMS